MQNFPQLPSKKALPCCLLCWVVTGRGQTNATLQFIKQKWEKQPRSQGSELRFARKKKKATKRKTNIKMTVKPFKYISYFPLG